MLPQIVSKQLRIIDKQFNSSTFVIAISYGSVEISRAARLIAEDENNQLDVNDINENTLENIYKPINWAFLTRIC